MKTQRESLLQKWVNGTLMVQDIQRWIGEQGVDLPYVDAVHVAECIHHIYEWRHGQRPWGLGRFLTAVLRNDLAEAAGAADTVNRKVIWLYPLYLINRAPADWRTWMT